MCRFCKFGGRGRQKRVGDPAGADAPGGRGSAGQVGPAGHPGQRHSPVPTDAEIFRCQSENVILIHSIHLLFDIYINDINVLLWSI